MRRLAIIVALTVAAAACSGGDAEIAGVGGTVIRLSEIRAYYQGDPAVDDSFRETLFARMAVEAAAQALASDYQATVDPAAVEDYYTRFQAQLAQAAATPADLLGVENASLELVRLNAEVLALRDAAVEALMVDPDVVDGLFADPATMTTVCVEHILVGTEAEAEAVIDRLEAGEDFATVAGEESLDTYAEGGDLGCTSSDDYVAPFAQAAMEAPLGEVFGPVETDYGFHVLIVSERTGHTREEYLADPWGLLSEQQLTAMWGNWLEAVLQAADAWVDEDYGVWTSAGIDPPASEATTTTSAG